jgi:ergothioneine biosynthesis protein EgtB
MPDVSPTRWHLAHTTWFFETFVLSGQPGYAPYDGRFGYLFNSYYNAVGEQFPRDRRGLLSRPSFSEIMAYREYVDRHVISLLTDDYNVPGSLAPIIELGLQHEQQHQELILTDIKHVFSCSPLWPAYRDGQCSSSTACEADAWLDFEEGLYWIGHQGDGFSYDNETPRHRVFLEAFQLASHPVTCGQYMEFIDDGGYQRPELWLSEGWHIVREHDWEAPLYWVRQDDRWHEFTLAGLKGVDAGRPVCHISYFEADAFARWLGLRLPTEAEWEVAANQVSLIGNFADSLLESGSVIHPAAASATSDVPSRMFGDVWEWTASQYVAYPGYRPADGALGEYNGKFMCNQFVLRGGSCATSSDHIRRSYRNFFPPHARWQFSGLRLGRTS